MMWPLYDMKKGVTIKAMAHYTLAPANFRDYRDFLKARFEELRGQNPKFSVQACASRAKISKSLLQFVFNKKRHVGLDNLPGLAKSLKLSGDEEYFVCLMICRGASKNAQIQAHFEGILNRLRHQHVKVDQLAPPPSKTDDKTIYQNHFLMNLLTLVRLPDFKEDLEWIHNVLQIPNLRLDEIQAALKELLKREFVERSPSGKLIARPDSVWRPDPFDPNGHRIYSNAAKSISDLLDMQASYRPSVYMAMSLALDEENLLKAERFMIEAHHKLFELSEKSLHPTAVAYVGNFFLTIARLKSAITKSN